jgi:hypothetical protein
MAQCRVRFLCQFATQPIPMANSMVLAETGPRGRQYRPTSASSPQATTEAASQKYIEAGVLQQTGRRFIAAVSR